jgi:DNA-binding NarL/FixJ family response regulator
MSQEDEPPATLESGKITVEKDGRITVLHADKDMIFQQCFAIMASDFRVISLEKAMADSAFARKPDVILVEVADRDYGKVVEFVGQFSGVPLVALSAAGDDAHLYEAIASGYAGYLLKSDKVAHIIEGVAVAARGGQPMSRKLSESLVARGVIGKPSGFNSLSAREVEVLRKLCGGMTTKLAAAELGISEKTIETHRARIYRKTGVRNLPELLRASVRSGIIRPDEQPHA